VSGTSFVIVGDSVGLQTFDALVCLLITAVRSTSLGRSSQVMSASWISDRERESNAIHTALATHIQRFEQRQRQQTSCAKDGPTECLNGGIGSAAKLHTTLRFPRLRTTLHYVMDQGGQGGHAQSVGGILRSLKATSLHERRVAVVVSVGPHYNNADQTLLRTSMQRLAITPEVAAMLKSQKDDGPNAMPGSVAVLEAAPQHFCTGSGLWNAGPTAAAAGSSSSSELKNTKDTRLFSCCPINSTAQALWNANWRNRHIEEGLFGRVGEGGGRGDGTSGIQLLRVFRALTPTDQSHRTSTSSEVSKLDCTHLGFPQVAFVVRVVLAHLLALSKQPSLTNSLDRNGGLVTKRHRKAIAGAQQTQKLVEKVQRKKTRQRVEAPLRTRTTVLVPRGLS
jgi:hypothetical protein